MEMTAPETEGIIRSQSQKIIHGEETPAYQVLRQANLLNTEFRIDDPKLTLVENGGRFDAVSPTSDAWRNFFIDCVCCPCVALKCIKTFTTPQAHISLTDDGRGNFFFNAPGVHAICDPFYHVSSKPVALQSAMKNAIVHGDRTIVIVEQGKIGYAQDKGHPLLLPPGLHMWKSPTIKFERLYDLNNNVIRMGPLTLVTVDEGYAAVTEDNGKQLILEGGETYLLTHRNWKFQKYISQKIQSDDLTRIEATSADNVLMHVKATVIWRILNVATAAKNSAETIQKDGRDETGDLGNFAKLRNDVLKQAEASLAAFIGAVNYSDTFHIAAQVQGQGEGAPMAVAHAQVSEEEKMDGKGNGPIAVQTSPLFDPAGVKEVLAKTNIVTGEYGVRVISINVVSAFPADHVLMSSLAQGAVAAAEAQKFETVARGRASAATIEAEGVSQAEVIRAKGDAQAELLRAEGSKKAADMLAASDTAVKFAMIDKTGHALSNKSTFFFGNDKDMGSMLVPAAIGNVAGLGKL